MTSDEAPLRWGGGMQYALPALPRRRLLFPALALFGMLLLAGCSAPSTKGSATDHNARGVEYSEKKKYKEAEKEFREALRLDPDYAKAHTNLGSVLDEQGKTEEAIAEYKEAIRLKPELAEIHYNFGIALGKQGKTEESISEYVEAIRLDPKFPEPVENLARLLDEQGKRNEARQYWERALKIEKKREWVDYIKKRLAEKD